MFIIDRTFAPAVLVPQMNAVKRDSQIKGTDVYVLRSLKEKTVQLVNDNIAIWLMATLNILRSELAHFIDRYEMK